MKNNTSKTAFTGIAARLTLACGLLQVALVLFSWIVSAVDVGLNVRSLLASDGIRWFFGTFATNVGGRVLVYVLLVCMACGAVAHSGLWSSLTSVFTLSKVSYRSHYALLTAFCIAILMCVCVAFLTFTPHGLLRSVTGDLFPSPFSFSLIPSLTFIIISSAVVYGLQSGGVSTIDDTFMLFCHGLRFAIPIIPLYVVAIELFHSVRFVFGW